MTEPRMPNKNTRWLVLSIGVMAQMTFAIAFGGIAVSGVLIRNAYHFSATELGFILGCMGLGVALSDVLWGILTDRLGDKRVLLIGLGLMGLIFAIMSAGVAPSTGRIPGAFSLGSLLILAGAVGASINSSSGGAVMSWFQDGERGLAMSIRQTAVPVGGALGAVAVPRIIADFGFGPTYLVLGVLCGVTFLFVWLWLFERGDGHAMRHAGAGKSPLERLAVWNVALCGALLTVPLMAILSFAPIYMNDRYHIDMVNISLIVAFIQVAGGGLRILAGRYSDRTGDRRVMLRQIACAAGLGGLALGLVAGQSEPLEIGLVILTGLAAHAWQGIGFAEIAIMSGPGNAGKALGMMGTTVFGANFLTPLLIPIVLQAGSWNIVWSLVGVASLLAAPLVLKPGLQQQTRKEQGRPVVAEAGQDNG
jgi:sugar phosphate permease